MANPDQGRRIYPDERGAIQFAEGDYGRTIHGEWLARPPGHHLRSLANHEVTEHEDGTITVSPSIRIRAPGHPDEKERLGWHGYLERGVWRKA